MKVATHVLKYLKSSQRQVIFLSKDYKAHLYVYCDSDWMDAQTLESLQHYAIQLGISLI